METIVHPYKDVFVFNGDLDYIDSVFYNKGELTNYREQQKLYNNVNSAFNYNRSSAFPAPYNKMYFDKRYCINWCYYNLTGQDVWIVDRQNLPVKLEPLKDNCITLPPCVLVRKEYVFDDSEMARETNAHLFEIGVVNGAELEKLKTQLSHTLVHSKHGQEVICEYLVPLTELMTNDGSVYHRSSDTLISIIKKVIDIPKHPCSPENINGDFTEPNNYLKDDNDVVMFFKYITNNPKATSKYINFGETTLEIKPQLFRPSKLVNVEHKDKVGPVELNEYIEVVYPAKVNSLNTNLDGFRVTRIGLNTAKAKYGIFNTKEEARHEISYIKKIEADLKTKIEQQELDHRIRERDLKEKIKSLEIDNEAIKKQKKCELDALRIAEERDSYVRKSNYEIIKFILATAASLIALIPLLMKLKKS